MKPILIAFCLLTLFSFNSLPDNQTRIEANDLKSESAGSRITMVFAKGTDIKVIITGGPNAGTYHVAVPVSTCSMGMTGDSSFGNQYSEERKKDNEMSSVQMIVDNYEAAKRGEDTDFNVTVGFGKLAFGKSYTVKTATGKLTISESGGGKTVTIEGKTTDGVKVNVVLICMTTQILDNGFLKEK